jgi:hypothetical protein
MAAEICQSSDYYPDCFCLHGVYHYVDQALDYFFIVSRRSSGLVFHPILGIDTPDLQYIPLVLWIYFRSIQILLGF